MTAQLKLPFCYFSKKAIYPKLLDWPGCCPLCGKAVVCDEDGAELWSYGCDDCKVYGRGSGIHAAIKLFHRAMDEKIYECG